MGKYQSTQHLKKAIGGGETFFGKATVIVIHEGEEYIYKDINVRVSYNVGYMQLDLYIIWEDDSNQVPYQQLELHGVYNTTFQNFVFSNGSLKWRDGDNKILLTFLN